MAIKPKLFKQMTKLLAGSMSAGRYNVHLAKNQEEVAAAQNLRYRVLFKESGGKLTREMLSKEREEDEWDDIAWHVVVTDAKADNAVVGTMRLVGNENLASEQAFYTEHAFDLSLLRKRYPKILELSRACVAPEGRGGAILLLIWKYTMQFIEDNKFDVMMGCASFHGTDYLQHVEILSYLYDNHLAAPDLMPKPVVDRCVDIASFKVDSDAGKKRGKVPTMLRGYLKIGACISDHAVIDPVFNTTFVAIYVDAAQMFQTNHALVSSRY